MKNSNGKRGKYVHRAGISTTNILLIIVAVAAIAAFTLFFAIKDYLLPTEPTVSTEQDPTISETEIEVTETQTQAETAPAETVLETPAETEVPAETENVKSVQSGSNTSKPTGSNTSKPSDTVSEQTSLSFPYLIPGTTLEIQKVDSYDGIFLEDGSDRNVDGIYTMILKNVGNVGVEYANIALIQDGKVLQFMVTAMPAGATMVIQESSGAAYVSSKFSDCQCEIALLETFEMSKDLVSVTEDENGSLVVTNLTGETIPCIRIFYKFYMNEEKVYVGGITYTAKVTELAGGESRVISPSHYAVGSSILMMVRTYETAD